MNTFFQFKQFRIEQDRCGMKVCTDSCLFGAYVNPENNVKRILDIGTGTGLLALMLAQRSQAEIDAVEIDPAAAEQARENAGNSPWKDRIRIHRQSIQNYSEGTFGKYDLIISNPPFFHKNLKSPDQRINPAYHNDLLSSADLIAGVSRLLTPDGTFAVMLPPHESMLLKKESVKAGLYLQKRCEVSDRVQSEVFRVISVYGFSQLIPEESKIHIKETDGSYSSDFRKLLSEYYLHL